jgi:hypothetical protein
MEKWRVKRREKWEKKESLYGSKESEQVETKEARAK